MAAHDAIGGYARRAVPARMRATRCRPHADAGDDRRSEPGRHHRIGHGTAAIEALFVDLFLEAHRASPRQIILDLDATNVPLHGHLRKAEVAVPRRLFAEVPWLIGRWRAPPAPA